MVGGWKNNIYEKTTMALIGVKPDRNDIVVHQMAIDKTIIESLFSHLCGKVRKESCINIIINKIPKNTHTKLGFSEYNLYYTWYKSKMPNNVLIDPTIKFKRTDAVNKGNGNNRDCNISPGGNVHMFVLETKSAWII